MSDTETPATEAPKKKGKLKKLLVPLIAIVVLGGGGVGAGVYAASSGLIGGAHPAGGKADPDAPQLVPKSEQKRAGEGKEEGGHGGGGEGEEASASHGGKPTPAGSGGEKYASNYYKMEQEFTSNLTDSPHFIQVGIAISTPYDDKVVEHLKTNDIAIRSAILMALGDTTEDQVFTTAGKQLLQRRLVAAINGTLKEKEGFGGVGNVYFTNFVVQ